MKLRSIIILLLIYSNNYSQSIQILDNSQYQHFAERLAVMFPKQFTSSSALKQFDSEEIKKVGQEVYETLSDKDKKLFEELINQYDLKKITLSNHQEEEIIKVDSLFYKYNNETSVENKTSIEYKEQRPILKYFYKSPHHFLSIDAPSISIRANPIVKLEYGNASNQSQTIFQNTRGAELSAVIDEKIYVFTRILENQQGFLPYMNQYIDRYKAIPQNGFYKTYNSEVIGKLSGYDFLNTVAYVTAPISKSIHVELGHGNHFIGNGYRSLLLSNFTNNYFYLKFNTRVWKFHYRNIFAELQNESANYTDGDELIGKKYMANHYLSIKPWNNFEIGIFESVIFNRENQFELQYLNPVIFYRTVEQFIGSSDNAFIGLNTSLNIKNRIQLYGQLMLDEFNLGLFKQDGWWGNKYGIQLGGKYFNAFGIDQLDLMAEYNLVRPYTYSHNKPLDNSLSLSSYANYNLSLAHPLGANFKEVIGNVKYNGISKLMLEGTLAFMKTGRNIDTLNYGQDILLNNTTRVNDFGNKTLQGQINEVLFLQLNASYELFTNYKIFMNASYRTSKSADINYNYDNIYLGGGIMINMNFDKNIF